MIQEFQNIFVKLTVAQWALISAFLVVFVVRFLYLLFFTGRVIFRNRKNKKQENTPPVSILFTLRNEEENIHKNLPNLLKIEDHDFEVVVVDDFSQDNSLSVLGLLNQRYGRLKISSLSQETRFSVKLAQNIALKLASNNWILMAPISLNEVKKEWIQSFEKQFAGKDTSLIVAYSTVVPAKGFFNLLYRIETFLQQIKSVGYISCGVPLVYSEENLAFKKEIYFELGGYGKQIQEPYANFELFINTFIKKKNTKVNFTSDSVIRKNVEVHKREYLDLLKKSSRIEKHLSFWKRQILISDEITKLLFLPLLAAVVIFCFPLWPLLCTMVTFYLLARVLIIKITLNRLNERKIFISSLVYGLIMPYFKWVLRWHFGRNSRRYKWRNVA